LINGGSTAMTSTTSARRYVGLGFALIVAAFAIAMLASLRSTASADPYPPTVCSSITNGDGAPVSGSDASCGIDNISVSKSPSADPSSASTHSANSSSGTAYTGFAAVTATVVAVALLGGGVLFVVAGRRRSHG
jgi:hypothetical protein